ncbi:hypothetical protein HPP92_026448 [Vanilla planifolia]|uniref:Uncharacterized protein n=1 Tax=Vanilla planifolia TaxID=51239 RepID=A0A835U7J9_VANPL|nr:hypothetical protein HPP92_026448 [Vanilla planifolia]
MAEEFDEEEVWASARDNRDARLRIRKPKGASSSSHTCSTSTTLAEGSTPPAPISIPNWCKTFKRSSSCEDEEEDEEGEGCRLMSGWRKDSHAARSHPPPFAKEREDVEGGTSAG